MYAKADFASVPNSHRLNNLPHKVPAFISRPPAAKFVAGVGQTVLTCFAVFGGLLGSTENLETMGIYLGQTHL